MKIRLVLLALLVSYFFPAISQDRFVVFFTDKNNSPYSLANPLQFLSQRAIDRRMNQGLAIDISDLPVNPQYVQGLVNAGAVILNTSKWFNAAIIQAGSPAVLNSINQLPYVNTFNNVGRYGATGSSSQVKFEPLLERTGNIGLRTSSGAASNSFNYGFANDQVNMLGLAQLHNQGYTGEGMLIAVIDAGFLDLPLMTCFDSILNNNQIIGTWDFVDHEADVYDDHYHGAAVLSCMAANVPDTLVGTAPHASYLLLRSEDAGSEYLIEEYNWSVAAEYADSAGADIINSSLGYTLFDDPTQNHFYSDMDGNTNPATIAADWAAKKGMLVLNSAGNEGNSPWNYISAPADADSILAVGAVDFSGTYASFSGNGPTADNRVKPDVAAMGQNTWLYSPYSNNQPTMGNGTSFSSPVLAGAVACLWQAWSQRSNMEIIQAVKRSASQFSNPDTQLGYGIPNLTLANSLLNLEEYTLPANLLVHVFPNPLGADEILTIVFHAKNSKQATLSIFDLSGRLVTRSNFETVYGALNEWKLRHNLPNGSYLLEINDGTASVVSKLIRY